MGKLQYLARSARNQFEPARLTCLNCGGEGSLVVRKYGLTALRRCDSCHLLYRTPTDDPEMARRFYNEDYVQGQTTSLPTLDELERMKANDFADLENDYAAFAALLKSLGAPEGGRVFDFGCSWGYGSYLFRKAGFAVKSFELSVPRRSFGEQHLGTDLALDFDAFVAENEGTFDVFFSSHVLEHVPQPSEVIRKGVRLLKPGGLLVSLVPNGSASFRDARPDHWKLLWGEVHPNFLDDDYLAHVLAGMPYLIGTTPVSPTAEDLRHLRDGSGERRLNTLDTDELFVAARKPG